MKRRATIQKFEPKPKKGKTSGDEDNFRDEDNDAYKTKKGVYILTWHDISKLDKKKFYKNPFFKKKVTISSGGNVHTMDISEFSSNKFKNFVKKIVFDNDVSEYWSSRGIKIHDEGIKVAKHGRILGRTNNFIILPIHEYAYDYDERTAARSLYGGYSRFEDASDLLIVREFIVVQSQPSKRMKIFRLTEAGRLLGTDQTENFDSNWEQVPKLEKELTFYRYTHSHISNNKERIDDIQREMSKYEFSVDRLPVDTPYEIDENNNIKSVKRDPYNTNMSEDSQWNYNTYTDERKFTVTFTMEIMEFVSNETVVRKDNHTRENLCTTYEYDSEFIKSQLQLLDSHFWRGAHIVPPIEDGDWFYQIRTGHGTGDMEFCLQLRGVDLNDIVRDDEYEEVRWYLRMFLREDDINRLLLIYTPTIIPVINKNKLFRQRLLYDNILKLKF